MEKKRIILLLFNLLAFWMFAFLAIPTFIPSPISMLNTLTSQFNLLFYHLSHTFLIAMSGIIMSFFLAFLLAVPMQFFKKSVYYAALPWIIISQAIPFIALGPLILVTFGYGIITQIYIITFLCYFPIFFHLYEGMQNIEVAQFKLLKFLGYSPFQILLKLRLPSALPRIFIAIQNGLPWGFSAAILSEFLCSERGTGALIETARQNPDNALIFSMFIIITLFNLFFIFVSQLIQKRLIPWSVKK